MPQFYSYPIASIVFVPLVKAKPVCVFCSQLNLSFRLRSLPSYPSISSRFLLHCLAAPSYSSCHMSDLLRSFFTLAHNKGHQLSLRACAGRRSLSTATRGKSQLLLPHINTISPPVTQNGLRGRIRTMEIRSTTHISIENLTEEFDINSWQSIRLFVRVWREVICVTDKGNFLTAD